MPFPSDEKCLKCGSRFLIKKGQSFTKMKTYWVQRYQCKDCSFKQIGKQRHNNVEEEFQYQSKPLPIRNWTAYTLAQNNHKHFLLGKLKELLDEIEIKEPPSRGRPQANLKEICFALALKSFTRLPSRRLHSELIEVERSGLITHIPRYSTLMKYLATEEITTILEALIHLSANPAIPVETDFASDSSGFSTSIFGRWFDARVGKEIDKRQFVKAHITIGVKTHIITSAMITPWNGADSPQFEPMINQTAERFEIREVSADAAYSSRNNLELVVTKGGAPFIPFKSNVTGNQGGSKVWGDSYRLFKDKPQEFGEHYHKRSNVEATFNMIKRKFSPDLMAKTYQSQKNELLLKILCHNITCLIHQHFEGAIPDPLWSQASFMESSLKKV